MSLMSLSTKVVGAVQKMMKKSSTCNYTKCHTPGRDHCPAKDSTCHACQKTGHWRQKCKSKKAAPGAQKKPNPKSQSQHQPGGRKRADEVRVSEGDPAFNNAMSLIHKDQQS